MTMISSEIYNLATLIKNTTEDKSWNLFNQSIMSDYKNLPLNLIRVLGENSSVYEEEIDIYNNSVFSIIYNHKYYIIIPDMESYGNDNDNDNDKKLIIIMKYNSLNDYRKAIANYYSGMGVKSI